MTAWPVTLPTRALLAGYTEKPEDVLLRVEMDAGPEFTRQRHTIPRTEVTCEVLLTDSQKATLRDFYRTTLRNGMDSFDWSPDGSEPVRTWHMILPPTFVYSPDSLRWRAQLSLRTQ